MTLSAKCTLLAVVVSAVLAVGCSTAGSSPLATGSSTPSSGPPTQVTVAPSGSGASPATLDRAWARATLTDASNGGTFKIADLVRDGKVVFVETMAIWCTKCLAQQQEAVTAFEGLDPDRTAWVAIDIESSETAEALAAYREEHRFPFVYVIADDDLARALVADFGDVVLSPPSVNIIVAGTDGRVTHLRGHKDASELRALAAEYGA